MLRNFLASLCLSVFLVACTAEPALDLETLETSARGGDQRAIARLINLLSARETGLADRSYATLVEIGTLAVPALLAQVSAGDKQQREYAIAAMGTLKVAEAVPAIAAVLADPAMSRRYVAAWSLGEIGGPGAVAPLIGALSDDNSEVRRYATRALIKLNRLAVMPLLASLDTARGEAAAAAIRALGDIADPRALEVLLARARGEERAEVFQALGKLRDGRAESALIDGLRDVDPRVRMHAAMALGPLGGPMAAEALAITLEDEVHVVREWSARSLEMITGQPIHYRNSLGEYVRPYNVYH